MSNERDKVDIDKLVSETYHELASEKVPERLNQEILRMAADKRSRTVGRGPLFAAWVKPVAWAATIGLSLVIVLEVNRLQDSTVKQEVAAERADAATPARVMKPAPAAKLPEEGLSRRKTRAMASDKKEAAVPDACSPAQRDTKEKWLDCIDDLRELGFVAEADREYAAYLLKYPAD